MPTLLQRAAAILILRLTRDHIPTFWQGHRPPRHPPTPSYAPPVSPPPDGELDANNDADSLPSPPKPMRGQAPRDHTPHGFYDEPVRTIVPKLILTVTLCTTT